MGGNMREHTGVVKTLLGREEVNPDRPDNIGRTPLSYAAEGRYKNGLYRPRRENTRVVKILLGQGNVNPDRPDNCGRTPLSYAAQRGLGTVAILLLGVRGVNPDKPDNNGKTPRMFAAIWHHMTWMALL